MSYERNFPKNRPPKRGIGRPAGCGSICDFPICDFAILKSPNYQSRIAKSQGSSSAHVYRLEDLRDGIDQGSILFGRAYADSQPIGNAPGNKAADDAALVLDAAAKLGWILLSLKVNEIRGGWRHAKAHLFEPRCEIRHALCISLDGKANMSLILQCGDCPSFCQSRNGKSGPHLGKVAQHLRISDAVSHTQTCQAVGLGESAQHDYVLASLLHVFDGT